MRKSRVDYVMTFGCDGWSDVCQNSVINFLALSSDACYLAASIISEGVSHDTEYLTLKARKLMIENGF